MKSDEGRGLSRLDVDPRTLIVGNGQVKNDGGWAIAIEVQRIPAPRRGQNSCVRARRVFHDAGMRRYIGERCIEFSIFARMPSMRRTAGLPPPGPLGSVSVPSSCPRVK